MKEKESIEEIATEIEGKSDVQFHRLPEDIYPGMPYFGVDELKRLRLTSYSPSHIRLLVRQKTVTAHRIGRQLLFDPMQLRELQAYEHKSAAGEINPSGRRPTPLT